jgi:hypothetical protein
MAASYLHGMVLSRWFSVKSAGIALAANDAVNRMTLSARPVTRPPTTRNHRERSSDLVERLDALQALVAPGSEHDPSWHCPALGVAGLG